MCRWEFCCYFSVDIISYTYRNLIQISQNIQYGERYIGSSLHTASVFGSHCIEPSHTSRSSGCCTELAAVSASASQLICLVSEDLGYECSCSYCAGVCFTYGDDFLDLIWRYTCSYCTVSCQCGGRSYHWVNTVIRVF